MQELLAKNLQLRLPVCAKTILRWLENWLRFLSLILIHRSLKDRRCTLKASRNSSVLKISLNNSALNGSSVLVSSSTSASTATLAPTHMVLRWSSVSTMKLTRMWLHGWRLAVPLELQMLFSLHSYLSRAALTTSVQRLWKTSFPWWWRIAKLPGSCTIHPLLLINMLVIPTGSVPTLIHNIKNYLTLWICLLPKPTDSRTLKRQWFTLISTTNWLTSSLLKILPLLLLTM